MEITNRTQKHKGDMTNEDWKAFHNQLNRILEDLEVDPSNASSFELNNALRGSITDGEREVFVTILPGHRFSVRSIDEEGFYETFHRRNEVVECIEDYLNL